MSRGSGGSQTSTPIDRDRLVALLAGGGLAGGTATAPTWTGATDMLVVNGDNIDKGSQSIEVLDYWMSLIPLAQAAGGDVVVLVGKDPRMAISVGQSFPSRRSRRDRHRDRRSTRSSWPFEGPNHEVEFLNDPLNSKSAPLDSEISGESPQMFASVSDPHGRFLHERPIAAVIDGWFFSHAGNPGGMSAAAIASKYMMLVDQEAWGDPFFLDANSIIEARNWWPSSGTNAFLDGYLAAIPAQHIVFGHSPPTFANPPTGDIEMHFHGRLTLIDVGMSSAVDDSTGKLLRVDPPGTAGEPGS